MARSNSGRIVVDIHPRLKRELHIALAIEGLTVKEWFVQNAETFLEEVNRTRDLACRAAHKPKN